MVCGKCEQKLDKLACPDKWKEDEKGKRKVEGNKLLQGKKRFAPYGQSKCQTCKSTLHKGGMYCHSCAHSKGLCEMCGVKILDTSKYKMSTR